MNERTEQRIATACGFLAIVLFSLAIAAPTDAGLPKISARALWPRQRTTTAQPRQQSTEAIPNRIIYEPTPAFLEQQRRREAIKNRARQ